MEKIAYKTEQETISMHVITFVALIFLPGTFVAVRFVWWFLQKLPFSALTSQQTFFQSGLLTWEPNGDSEELFFNWDGFELFAKICFPLMAFTLIIWWWFYVWLKSRARRRFQQEEV